MASPVHTCAFAHPCRIFPVSLQPLCGVFYLREVRASSGN